MDNRKIGENDIMKKRLQMNQKGMTLIEILIVLAIISLIGTVVVTNVVSSMDQANIDATRTKIKSLENALLMFRKDAKFFPSTEQGLEALVEKPSGGRVPKRYQRGGYVNSKNDILDAWDMEFTYYSPGQNCPKYEIISIGPDNSEGTEDDISSCEASEE